MSDNVQPNTIAQSGSATTPDRALAFIQDELDSAMLYDALAAAEHDERVAEVYRRLAATERRHADHWNARMRAGTPACPTARPAWTRTNAAMRARCARSRARPGPKARSSLGWKAAIASFVLFAIGAIIPLAPFVLLEARTAVAASLVASGFGLFAIGAAITLLTGRGVWFSGLRQVFVGLAAAALTFGAGHLVGRAFG